MKYILIILTALAVTGCKSDLGVKKGIFEGKCTLQGGTVTKVAPNEYKCTLKDGTEYLSVDKKDTGTVKNDEDTTSN